MSENLVKVWNRDFKFEARAKTNFMYRTGALFGVLAAWAVVGAGLATFINFTITTGVFYTAFTAWDMRKVWKGKTNAT